MQNGKEVLRFKTDVCKIHYANEMRLIHYQYILQENQFLLCRKKECYDPVAGMDMIKLVTRIIYISVKGCVKEEITDNPFEYKRMMESLMCALQTERINSVDDFLCARHHTQSLHAHPLGNIMR